MSDLHINDFFKDAARILCRLYLSFPQGSTLFVEDICGNSDTDEFGIHSDRYLACLSAMLWLAEEEYLRYTQTIRQEALDQAVLTGRCFSLLCSPCPSSSPSSSEDQQRSQEFTALPQSVQLEQGTHIYALREALKSGSSDTTERAVKTLMRLMTAG